MFSRDYHDPRSHALWGIRVLGTTICIHTGVDMGHFDLGRLNFYSSYTWRDTPEEAMAYAEREIQQQQEASWVETERSRSRRCFELVNDKHRKFWIIERDGACHMIRFGRIPKDDRYSYVGPAGQTRTKPFPSAEKARASYEKLIRQKAAEGYVERYPRPTRS
ncbi:MAG TPA: WGR domain-containing protein [Gemmataceae bacterium]|jgi:predicted DNA-binding WGR domain protein